ncbi:hypothetical protein L7F22_019360 [Adiantum nelumboides]|nr:hypothetical protein [Adiantum nelumboides]
MFQPQDQQHGGTGPPTHEQVYGQEGSGAMPSHVLHQPHLGSDGGTSTPDSINQAYSPYPPNLQQQFPQFEMQYGAPPQMHDMRFPTMYPTPAPYQIHHAIGPMNPNMYGQFAPPLMPQGISSPLPHHQPSPYNVPPPPQMHTGGQRQIGVRPRRFPTPQQSIPRTSVGISDGVGSMQSGNRGLSPTDTPIDSDQSTEIQSGASTSTSTSKSTILTNVPSFLPSKPSFSPNTLPAGHNEQINTSRQAMARTAPAARRNVYQGEYAINPIGGIGSTSYQAPEAPVVPLLSRFPSLPPRPEINGENDVHQVAMAFQQREEALIMRIEALGFEPESAWRVMNELERNQKEQEGRGSSEREVVAPVLGIRLLQRIDALQKENEKLEDLLKEQIEEKTVIRSDLADASTLIQEMDVALVEAEKKAESATARAIAQERALAIACAQQSSAILDVKKG